MKPSRLWLLAPFALQFGLLDAAVRGLAPFRAHPLTHSFAVVASATVWASLALLWPSRAWRVFVAILAAFFFVLASAFAHRFGSVIDAQVIRSTLRYWPDIVGHVRAALPGFSGAVVLLALAEALLLEAATRGAPRLPPRLLLGAALVGGSTLAALPHSDTVERLMVRSVAHTLVTPVHAASAGAVTLPGLHSRSEAPPSILVVLTESVRADSYCSAPSEDCQISPRVNQLLPDRLPLLQMRATGSYTVVSMAALTTGHAQNVPRSELVSWPTVFDWMKAIHTVSGGITTAYWSAHAHPIFERESTLSAIDSYLTAKEITGEDTFREDADERLLARVARDLPTLPRPFFLVVHLIGTHTPYAVRQDDAPFRPWERDWSWSGLPLLFNTYRNAIVKQDALLADTLRPILDSKEPLVLFFTSDHGEEFGEHKRIHHGHNVLDEQIHVPAWFDARGGGLSPAALRGLASNRDQWVTHLDVLPTLLDVHGVLDSYEVIPLRKALPGRSLLATIEGEAPLVPLTNCTEAFPCPFNNWGLLQGEIKLEAQQWDPHYNCWKVGGAETLLERGDPRCKRLAQESARHFPTLPNGAPP